MEILVAILVIALIAAIAFVVMRRRPGGDRGLGRQRSPRIARRQRRVPPNDPMAAAVEEQMRATDPHDLAVSEQRLQAEARRKAATMLAEADRVEQQRAAGQTARGGSHAGDPRVNRAEANGTRHPEAPVVGDGDVHPATPPAGHGDAYPVGSPAYGDTARSPVYGAPAAAPAHGDPRHDDTIDPATGERSDAYRDPAADPRYDDPSDDRPPPADYDPRYDDRGR